MIGDTNVFMTDETDATLAEIEIMIAETGYRKNGRGKESTLLMLKYGEESYIENKQHHLKNWSLKKHRYRAIGSKTVPSQNRTG